MLILKVISRLLDYPSEALFSASDELIEVVKNDAAIRPDNKLALISFINKLTARDLLDLSDEDQEHIEKGVRADDYDLDMAKILEFLILEG